MKIEPHIDNPLQNALNILCPLHAVISPTGHILHAGATFQKLHESRSVLGLRLLEVLELKRPSGVTSMDDLRGHSGAKLHFRLRRAPWTEMKGVLATIRQETALAPKGGGVLNLSFGISAMGAVKDFHLTSTDFAVTDLTVEMLYLVEAKSAAMDASRVLNLRLQGAKIEAEAQAVTDMLTGLGNRRAMDQALDQLCAAGLDFALMHLDLDFFKAINDEFGHAAGDFVLQQAATIMRQETRDKDAAIRIGGDEFVLIFAGATDQGAVESIAKRLIEKLEQPVTFNGHECRVSASIGIVLSLQYDMIDLTVMMDDADVALYAAKKRGRRQYMVYDPTLRSHEKSSC